MVAYNLIYHTKQFMNLTADTINIQVPPEVIGDKHVPIRCLYILMVSLQSNTSRHERQRSRCQKIVMFVRNDHVFKLLSFKF